MFFGRQVIGTNNENPTSYTVTNGTLTSAVFPNLGSPGNNHQYAIVDQIYRPARIRKRRSTTSMPNTARPIA